MVLKILPRVDGKPGWQDVVPTDGKFVEADGSDVRMRRVYVRKPGGEVEKTYLIDPMGAPWADTLGYRDDPDYPGGEVEVGVKRELAIDG